MSAGQHVQNTVPGSEFGRPGAILHSVINHGCFNSVSQIEPLVSLITWPRTEPIEPILTAEYRKTHPAGHTSPPTTPAHQPTPTRPPPATQAPTSHSLAGGGLCGWCGWWGHGWWLCGPVWLVCLVGCGWWGPVWCGLCGVAGVPGIRYDVSLPNRTEPALRNTGNTKTAKYRIRVGIDRTARLQPCQYKCIRKLVLSADAVTAGVWTPAS